MNSNYMHARIYINSIITFTHIYICEKNIYLQLIITTINQISEIKKPNLLL